MIMASEKDGRIVRTLNISYGRKTPPPPPPMMWKMTPQMMAEATETSFPPEFFFCGKCSSTSTATTTWSPGSKTSRINNDRMERSNIADGGEEILKELESYQKRKDEMDEIETSSVSTDSHSDNGSISNSDDDDSKKYMRKTLLLLEPLSSPSHVLLIESLIRPIKGVHRVLVSQGKSEIYVDHDAQIQEDRLTTVLSKGGYPTATLETLENTTTSAAAAAAAAAAEPTTFVATTVPAVSGTSITGTHDSKKVRSQFLVRGICCLTEVPMIRKIVKGVPGAGKVQINIATKMVYIFHDPLVVSASVLAKSLTREGFPSRIIKDGGTSCGVPGTTAAIFSGSNKNNSNNTVVGRTTLHIKGALTQKSVSPIQHEFAKFPGVKKIVVNIAGSVVFIDHDVTKVSAEEFTRSSIFDHRIGIVVAKNAEDELHQRQSALFSTKSKSNYVESTIFMSSLSSSDDIERIQRVLKQNTTQLQVRAAYPHVASQTIKVEHNPDLLPIHTLVSMLEKRGFQVEVIIDGKEEGLSLPMKEDYINNDEHDQGGMYPSNDDKNSLGQIVSKLHLNVVLSGMFWFLSMISVFDGVWQYLEYAGLLSVFFGLPPVAFKAWRTIRRRQFDANCMMVTAALGALLLQEYDEAASVAFLFAVSELLEERSTLKARRALEAIVNLRPDHASVIHPITKEIVVVPAESVPVGSLISVRMGDKVATDGVVVEGTSTMDESSLTGESVPVLKKVEDNVSGGSINIGTTQLIVKTTSTVEDSAVSRLIHLVEEAQSNRSPTEKLVDSFARSYTPLVATAAAIMCTIPWFFGKDIGHYWTLNGLIIIVIACPCALTISTPVTYAAGLAATAQRGVIVKGGARLEALGNVDKVLFDKTGTLTHGKFSVVHLEHIGENRPRKEMLRLLALMEAPSSHPLSATLVQAAKSEGVSVPTKSMKLLQHTVLQGEGVTAKIDGKQVYVGNQRLFNRVGMYEQLSQHYKDLVDQWNGRGGTIGFIGVEGEGICGSFCMIDTVRPEAREVIDSFHSMGIQVMMLTGDNDGSAKAVAKEVGLPTSSVHSQLLPEDKLHFVGSLIRPTGSSNSNNFLGSLLGRCAGGSSSLLCQSTSLVLFCGDGVNDGPALSVADVGVSMGGEAAATLTMEMSDVTLMDSNLSKLLYVIKMGKRVVDTIQENILFSLLAKIVVVLLTFLGKMTLFAAIASDVGVMLIVTLNGMKLLPSSSIMSDAGNTSGINDTVGLLENEECGFMTTGEDNGSSTGSSKLLLAMKRRLPVDIFRNTPSNYHNVPVITSNTRDSMDDFDDTYKDNSDFV